MNEILDRRVSKVVFSKSGSGSINKRITIPLDWVEDMNITNDEKEVILAYDNVKKILTVKKKKVKKNKSMQK